MLYRFEGYLLDAERRELRRGAELLAVEPQVFDLLEYLVRNHQRVVSKNDLVAGVWDGRIVAESTLSSRMTAVRKAVGDDGERQRLIRTIPRKGFRFIAEVRRESRQHNNEAASGTVSRKPEGESRPTMDEAALSLPDKPSIAVLPFANISGDPAQRYFVDGVVEDITTALSQFRWLFVIARSSSFTYEGRAVDVKQVGRELGVRYVLEGSIRKAANRVRITAQLIDATTATHLWADRFDGAIEDIFDLQDQLTASVVGAIGPKLERAEIERAKRKPTDSLDAYDHYLRGMDKVYQWTRQSIAEALALFHQAIRVDPGYASAYGMAAYCYVQRKSYGWFVDRPEEVAEAVRLARQAAALGKDDAVALSKAAHAFASLIGDAESGVAFIDQALQLNPNLAAGWYVSGWLRIFFGEPEFRDRTSGASRAPEPVRPVHLQGPCRHGLCAFFRRPRPRCGGVGRKGPPCRTGLSLSFPKIPSAGIRAGGESGQHPMRCLHSPFACDVRRRPVQAAAAAGSRESLSAASAQHRPEACTAPSAAARQRSGVVGMDDPALAKPARSGPGRSA